MTLDQLYYFKKLAELQHYTKAATELFISQPSLSYSIDNLEKELGTSLFHKKGINVILTNQGKEFYNCINDGLTKLDDGIESFKKSVNSDSYRIAIGTIPLLHGDFISKSIKTYMNFSEQTTFDLFTCLESKEIIEGIYNGIYDIGFCFKIENDTDLVFIPMIRQELVVIANKGHDLSYKERLNLNDLKDYPLITYREKNYLGIFIRKVFKEQRITPHIAYTFDGEITISEMVAHDFGIAVVANIPILKNYLSIIPLDIESESPYLYLVYHKNSNKQKSIKKFIRHLMSYSSFE